MYSASSRDYYSEAHPAKSWPKKKDFRRCSLKFGRVGHQQGTQLKGEIMIHADGPTNEFALRCTVAKWDRGIKSLPLAAELSTLRAAKTDTGQQRAQR